MRVSLLYRVASVLLVLFAIGHTLGFQRTDPRWGADSVVGSMRTTRFNVDGFSRTYWDFFTGFGLFVTAFLVFAAILAWQLGGLTKDQLMLLSVVSWTFAICFVGITVLSWMYFFIIPGIFSSVVGLCLVLAAWLAQKP
jgi:hypothetical protein